MKGLNRTEIIGNVGAEDAKLGTTTMGTPVADFSVAVNDSYKDREGNKKETTTWYKVSIYGKRAEALAPYIKSGMTVYVAGRAGTDAWISGEGIAKSALTLTLGDGRNDFLFLGGGQRGDELPEETPDADDDQLFTDRK